MLKKLGHYAAVSMLTINAAMAADITITSPSTNAVVGDAITLSGACNNNSKVKGDVRDSNNLFSTQNSVTCANSKYSISISSAGLLPGQLRIRALQAVGTVSQAAYVYVQKNAPISLQILSPAKDLAVTSANMASIAISGKCTDKTIMKLQATDSAKKLSDITWIMCENSNFWGPINMSSLADGNISVRAFQEVNGVMNNQYLNVIKKTAVVAPPLAISLGTLASVKEGVASNLIINKTAGTAAGSVAYQILNNASKAVLASGTLAFAANDTSKTISVLAPDDAVYNADMKLEIKVGSLASLIVPVIDNDPIPLPPLAYNLGALASVNEGVAANLAVNKVAGTAGGSIAYQILNNASKAVISSGTLTFAATDTAKSISVLAPDDAVYNTDMKLEIKVGSLASLIVSVVDNDKAPVTPLKNIIMGINGHDAYPDYTEATMEARFKILDQRNIRSYRNGGDLAMDEGQWPRMDKLISLAAKYNVNLRTGMYLLTQAQAYKIVKRFPTIKTWEIGNELDMDVANMDANVAKMLATYKGIRQAADELGLDIKVITGIVACNSDAPTASGGTCYNKPDGSGFFLDKVYAAGIKFDYISFHYYPLFVDKGYWMDKYLGQMRAVSQKYGKKVFFNELNCGEIYPQHGSVTDGGFSGDRACYDSVQQMLTILNTSYKDVVEEINIYELLDEPNNNSGYEHEKHFGMMYDNTRAKPIFDMVSGFAK